MLPLSSTQKSGTSPMRISGLLLALLWLPSLVLAYSDAPIDAGIDRRADPVLGVSATFGKWNSPVFIGYDPDGAPALFANNAQFVTLLNTAMAQWERVSGIDFQFAGINSALTDDRTAAPENKDFLVRVSWGTFTGSDATASGRAGAALGYYDPNFGFASYIDGSLELNNTAGMIDSDETMVRVLVHELGHLIGLGHSNNPLSAMFANPYNGMRYPREDDIRAVQTLYGPPANAVDATRGLPEWQYAVPAAASASTTQYLFKPNQATNNSAYFSLSSNGAAITGLSSSTSDDAFVWLQSGGLGNWNNTANINLNTQIVILDPYGYVFDKVDWNLQCAATLACGGAGTAVYKARMLKLIPGTWKFLVINKANNTLLLTMNLPVQVSTVRNSPPTATVRADALSSGLVQFTIAATDAERDAITVVWNPLVDYGVNLGKAVSEAVGSSGVVTRVLSFSGTGKRTFFVELRDNSTRYNTAISGSGTPGDGFQNLLRITVTLPFTGAADYEVVGTQTEDPKFGGSGSSLPLSAAELTAIANTPALAGVATTDGSATTAKFSVGASRDRGATTRTAFTSADTIAISALATVQTADLGKAGSFYVVVRTGATWVYRNASGGYSGWDGRVVVLQPVLEVPQLPASTLLQVYTGRLPPGDYFVYVGYKASGSNTLHYTTAPQRLTVTN